MKVTVIIPTLNEAADIARAVSSAKRTAEVIVADGGSRDSTREIASGLGATVIETPRGRGLQMDEAAKLAKGDVLLFLHADTMLPEGWFKEIERALVDPGTIAGAFGLRIGSTHPWFRVVEAVVRLRYRALGVIYGDQAIFARKDEFFKAGGFRKLPLMEDVDCVKRLRGLGRVRLLKGSVVTSPRRWEAGGMVGNTLKNGLILALYMAGVPPERLYDRYYGRQ
ncbi:MAG: TIGR04283 family arsenosugar biosynthesis glycosyltransferase [Deltaproteobacteria bacterium]|nr:TIGR04283 family arsenosugar biosynthesis glycosyltransferase [Deltaproteobacteria bacterium]